MTTEYVQRLHFFLAGIIRFGWVLIAVVSILFLAGYTNNELFDVLFNRTVVESAASNPKDYDVSIILTLIFVLTFAYSLFGAVISGASNRKTTESVCYNCLFSTALAFSIVGFGLSWIEPMTLAIWWMISTVGIVVVTSYLARREIHDRSH